MLFFFVVVSSSRHKLPWGPWFLEGLVHQAHHVGPKCAKQILFLFNIIIKKLLWKHLFLVEVFSGQEIFPSTKNNWLQTIVCSCAIAKNVADNQSRPLSIRYPGPAERYSEYRTKGSQHLGTRLVDNMLVSRASRDNNWPAFIQINLPGVLKTGLPEILSQVQHIAGNLSKLNLLKAVMLLA